MARFGFYIGLFLITACTLMLQVIQTRILSVVAWYHLAFFAISMAMFGLTAGAVWVYLQRDHFTERTLSYDLSYFSIAFALATVLCILIQMTLAPVLAPSMTSILVWLELAICMAIPFFFSGVVVSLALTRSPFPIGRVYGVDLLGAALGCLGVLLILNNTDGPSAVLWIGAIIAAAACFFSKSRLGVAPDRKLPFLFLHRTAIFVFLIAFAIVNGLTSYGFQPLVAKGNFEHGGAYDFQEWNTFSRISVSPKKYNREPFLWGPSPKLPKEVFRIDQRNLNIDGDAGTMAFHFTGDFEKVGFLKYDVTNLAYYLPGRKRSAVIGVGGGRDILSAATFGFHDITGVEINPIFVKLLIQQPGFTDFTNLTSLEGVKFVIDEGRSWFARTDQRFDIIQMSLVDTWAATGAGAFSLSENGLYTVEAWKIFLNRLTPNGVYTVSRWFNPNDPSETARMLSLAMAALLDQGISEPQRHLFLVAQGQIATLLLSKMPFSLEEIKIIEDVIAKYDHQILISPTVVSSNSDILHRIIKTNSRKELDRYTSNLNFDLTPPTDDRPFFFNQLPFNKPIQALKFTIQQISWSNFGLGGIRQGNLVATATLLVLFSVSLLLVLATIVIPLRPAVKDVGSRLTMGGTLYFLLIGIGFMMVEIGLLQRTSVFLGHPIYSLSVLLFTLILATGIGSLLSDRLMLDSNSKFVGWAILTGGYIMLMPWLFSTLFPAFDKATLLVRAMLCVVTIAPTGILMGFGFPTGMRLISRVDRKPTPWFWGINGAAGVLASIIAVACSIAFGISATLMVGAICYLLLIPTVLSFIHIHSEQLEPA